MGHGCMLSGALFSSVFYKLAKDKLVELSLGWILGCVIAKGYPPKYAHVKIKKHAHANLPMVGANDHDFSAIINLI